MESNTTRGLVESGLLVALAVILFLASHFLPVAGVAVAFVCPVPLVVLGLRHSLGRALLGAGVAMVIVTTMVGVLGGLFFGLGFGATGIALGYFARRSHAAVEILLYALLVSLGAKLLLMVLATKMTGINPFSVDPEEVRRMTDAALSMFGSASPETLQVIRGQMEGVLQALPILFPALLVMASGVDTFLSYAVSGAVLRRLGRETLPPLPRFEAWRFPKSLFWALLVSAVLTLFGGSPSGALSVPLKIGVNLRILVSMLFFLQGSAVVLAFLQAKKIGAWRWGVFVLFLLVPLLSQLALILGIIDMWFDIRSRIGR
ncbi:MAG TPA: DUF2232 domain-containing protein [Synergistaceae bacterium]|nr:DUF2232 domain-containing protein [Synergistaceae bacterium]